MNKYVVVVFPDETKAYEGLHALEELHAEGSVTIFGAAVVRRQADGTLFVVHRSDQGPLGFSVGALVGGLIGLFGGPAGGMAGWLGGGLIGGWRDYLRAEVTDEFLDSITRDVTPGSFSVIAEASEEWTTPIDTRMEELGGKVVRGPRQAFVDSLLQRRVDAMKSDLDERKAERASAKAEKMASKLRADIDQTEVKLKFTAQQVRTRMDETKVELDAKLEALQEQAAKANPDVKSRIEQRIAELRKDFSDRMKMLKRAYELTEQALA